MLKVGTIVKYIHECNEEEKATGYYPPIGTLGVVLELAHYDILVKWDSGTKGDGDWFCGREDVEEMPKTMYDRIKEMTRDEMQQFIYWVYLMGNKDGRIGFADSSLGFFGGVILDVPVEELMPNGISDLWDIYEKRGELKCD